MGHLGSSKKLLLGYASLGTTVETPMPTMLTQDQ